MVRAILALMFGKPCLTAITGQEVLQINLMLNPTTCMDATFWHMPRSTPAVSTTHKPPMIPTYHPIRRAAPLTQQLCNLHASPLIRRGGEQTLPLAADLPQRALCLDAGDADMEGGEVDTCRHGWLRAGVGWVRLRFR